MTGSRVGGLLVGSSQGGEDFSGTHAGKEEAFVAGGFTGFEGHGTFGQTELFGDKFTAKAVRRPFERRRGETHFQLIPLRADYLVFTGARLDKEMNGDALLANLQPGGECQGKRSSPASVRPGAGVRGALLGAS